MSDDRLIAACERNFVESWRELAPETPVRYEQDGVVFAGPGFVPAWLNSLFITRPLANAVAQLTPALDLLDSKNIAFFARIRSDLDESTEAALIDHFGLQYHDSVPSMVLDPIHQAPQERTALDIRTVNDDALWQDFVDVTAASYGFERDLAARILPPRVRAVPGSHFFVGYLDGAAVAASELIVIGDAAGVNLIGTVEGFRGRGFGEAATWHVIRAGAQAGCRIAVLQASDMGRPIYERMGFRVVCEHKSFVHPDGREEGP